MFGKWFKRKVVPSNDGNSAAEGVAQLRTGKTFELQLSNMEDSPVYPLTDQLSVGSEIGNIVVSDPSLSPRHATFILQQEVVSVVDHGSVAGTFVNGKKIGPGKYIILEESDTVMVGDLEIKLKVSTVRVKEEHVPEPPKERKLEIKNSLEDREAQASGALKEKKSFLSFLKKSRPEDVPAPSSKSFKKTSAPAGDKKKKAIIALSAPQPSANALMRVIAVSCDLLLSYSVLLVFQPFDEFREFLDFIPHFVGTELDIDWGGIWSSFLEDYAFVGEILKEGYQLFSQSFDLIPLLLVFVLNRLATTLLFGVSFSERMLGMRPSGNLIWARIGGMVRVLLGIVTGPLVIFDVPAVVSRRTLKEFLTFTNVQLPSKIFAAIGIIFYVPFTLALLLIAPVFQGFEIPDPIMVNDRIDQRVKLKQEKSPEVKPVQETAPAETKSGEEALTAEASPPAQMQGVEGAGEPSAASTSTPEEKVLTTVKDQSGQLLVEIGYHPEEISLIPAVRFQGEKKKITVKPSLIVYQKELQRSVEVELFKTFDMKELLTLGMKNNFLYYEKFPEIYNYVYESSEANPAFKKNLNARSHVTFSNEFIQFTKVSFSLGLENVLEFMQTETPFLKNIIDFRTSLLALVEYKDFDQIGFIRIGNTVFMKFSFNRQKPFDLLVPLLKGPGRMYKVTFDKKENLGTVASNFYKFNLINSDWLPEVLPTKSEVLTALQVFDLFAAGTFKQLAIASDRAQAFYGYYYETSAGMMKAQDPVELELWKEKLAGVMKFVESIQAPAPAEGAEDPKGKLLQNLRDLIDALENKNLEYFGISSSQTI